MLFIFCHWWRGCCFTYLFNLVHSSAVMKPLHRNNVMSREMSLDCARKRDSMLSSAKEMTHALTRYFMHNSSRTHRILFRTSYRRLMSFSQLVRSASVDGIEAAAAYFFAHVFERCPRRLLDLVVQSEFLCRVSDRDVVVLGFSLHRLHVEMRASS